MANYMNFRRPDFLSILNHDLATMRPWERNMVKRMGLVARSYGRTTYYLTPKGQEVMTKLKTRDILEEVIEYELK